MNRTMKLLKTESLPLLLVAATWVLAAIYWPTLPDPMPTHWGIGGKPDAFMPKPWGVMIGPATATVLYLVLTALPYLDPRSAHWEAILKYYPVLKNAILALLAFITYLSFAAARSPNLELRSDHLVVAIGLLFVVMGNYLPKVRSNFFLGVRTPWTLSNDQVWDKTQRIAGRLMVVAGLVIVGSAWLPPAWRFGVTMASVAIFAIVPLVYSWVLYRRLGVRNGSS